mmetsp:Transcript_31791/g.95174  ORF Transcript_31791/g.95174 Transcript_31791/m.95174 type:complete len:269 (+) Transcript_31791:364-1170(+)
MVPGPTPPERSSARELCRFPSQDTAKALVVEVLGAIAIDEVAHLLHLGGGHTEGRTRRGHRAHARRGANGGGGADARGRRWHLPAHGVEVAAVLVARCAEAGVEVNVSRRVPHEGAAAGDVGPRPHDDGAVTEVGPQGVAGELALLDRPDGVLGGASSLHALGVHLVFVGGDAVVLDLPLVNDNVTAFGSLQFQYALVRVGHQPGLQIYFGIHPCPRPVSDDAHRVRIRHGIVNLEVHDPLAGHIAQRVELQRAEVSRDTEEMSPPRP